MPNRKKKKFSLQLTEAQSRVWTVSQWFPGSHKDLYLVNVTLAEAFQREPWRQEYMRTSNETGQPSGVTAPGVC